MLRSMSRITTDMKTNQLTPVPVQYTAQILFVLRGADFQLTTDQVFQKLGSFTKYHINDIVASWKTGAATVACDGGIYDAASKGGNALVAAGQSWLTLASGVIVQATRAAVTNTAILTGTPILSLTTGSTGAVTADVFVFGFILD